MRINKEIEEEFDRLMGPNNKKVIFRVFHGNKLVKCSRYGEQDDIVIFDLGREGAKKFCFGCLYDLIETNCTSFD
jgi:hypothetical protein